MASFYSPASQTLFDDILWLPQKGATAGPEGRPPNSYAVLQRHGSILVDAAHPWTLEGIDALAAAGHPPVTLLLTHAHAARDAEALDAIVRDHGTTVMLHPDDVDAARAAGAGVSFADPVGDESLKKAGLDVIPMPYHTPGSIMLAMEEHRGVLFCGDSALAPGPLQAPEPPRLERPAVSPHLDAAFRKDWEVIATLRGLTNVLPRHGTPYTDRVDLHEIISLTWQGPALAPGEPSGTGPRALAEGVTD